MGCDGAVAQAVGINFSAALAGWHNPGSGNGRNAKTVEAIAVVGQIHRIPLGMEKASR